MNDADYNAAIQALRAWLSNQKLTYQDAVPVLGSAIAEALVEIAKKRGSDPFEGLEAAAEGIANTIKELVER